MAVHRFANQLPQPRAKRAVDRAVPRWPVEEARQASLQGGGLALLPAALGIHHRLDQPPAFQVLMHRLELRCVQPGVTNLVTISCSESQRLRSHSLVSNHEPNPATRTPAGEVTLLLRRLAEGDDNALNEVFPLVYEELRRISRGQRRRRGPLAPLDTTALIHEAYLRFAQRDQNVYNHRNHFYAVAATAMRQILLDVAKGRRRVKRGGEVEHQSLDAHDDIPDSPSAAVDQQAELMIALDQALERLGRLQERVRRVVDCRFFGGLTEAETAEALGVDARTIRRDWAKARAWLAVELELV